MDIWRLAVVNRFVIIKAICRVRNTGYAILLGQTQHCVDVRLLLRLR